MSTIKTRLMTLFAAALLVAGCASGPKYSELAAKMPPIASGEGRIYFYRESSMMGAAVQPDIRLNGAVVGTSKPGGYFYVDRPAGNYVAAASTETEKTASFRLDAGETKYLKSAPSFGLVVGRIVITIESPDKAKAELASLSNTGAMGKP
jgi:hypothetical protein